MDEETEHLASALVDLRGRSFEDVRALAEAGLVSPLLHKLADEVCRPDEVSSGFTSSI